MRINWDREKGRKTVKASIESWPVSNKSIRLELLKQDTCPECGSELDTGWECNGCQFDGRTEEAFDRYIKREIKNEKAAIDAA
jgi:hypothetical protein